MVKEYKTVVLFCLAILVGALTATIPQLALLLGIWFFIYGLWRTIIKRNNNGEAHLYATFIMGAEVYFRMSFIGLPWEFSKLAVFSLLSTGLIVESLRKPIPIIFILYLLMLLPAVFIPDWVNIMALKKEFMFTFFGQIVLVVSVFYFYKRDLKMENFLELSRWMILALILMSSLLYLKTPDYSSIHYGGGSNFEASGGFGPNQVAAMLGLGSLLVGYFLMIQKRVFRWMWLDILIFFIFTFQGMITFSRGGLFSAILSLMIGVFIIYVVSPQRAAKLLKINFLKLFLLGLVLFITFIITNSITGGALEKRYTNIDQYGNQIKEDYSTKRMDIILEDIEIFKNHVFTGTGIGGGRELREYTTGISAAHVEFSRMLAEHGALGLFALIILFLYPVYRFFIVDDILTKFSLVIFVSYGLLTMSHNALRLAMPSFLYGLGLICLISVSQDKGKI